VSEHVDQPDLHLESASGWRLLDAVDLAACVLDRALRYRRVNTAWTTYLQGDTFRDGPREVALADRDALADLPGNRRERWAVALSAMVDGRLSHFLDRCVERSSVGDRLVLTTASPIVQADGKVDGVLCVRYDVTEAERSAANEERLTQVLLTARRLQHFLGNQLALTLGYVELLTYDPRLPSELRDRVDEALRGVIEATETLTRLRRVTRLELAHDDPSLVEHLGHSRPP
jgi:hypothetical protein